MDRSKQEETFPLDLAVNSINYYLTYKTYLPAPLDVPELFRHKAGAFVTLKKGGGVKRLHWNHCLYKKLSGRRDYL